jgi:mRNA-degrading endonuclease RelE of RelBE toxin-antitoxin system
MTARLLSPAHREFEEAVLYYESRPDGLGAEFVDEFDRSIAAILEAPSRWPQVAKEMRKYRMRRFEYGIIYGVQGEEVVVAAVAHPSRQSDYWVDRI